MEPKCVSANGKLLLLLFLIHILFASCAGEDALDRIKRTGEVTVVTRHNAHCYYTYKGNLAGFEYDLARAFSNHLDVKLRVITPAWAGLIDKLNSGKGDFIAASMTITPSRKKMVDFSNVYLKVRQMVIIHKNNHGIKKLEDLKGKTIYVRRGTSYEGRLNKLKSDGLDIHIELNDDITTEELIRMVAEKEIQVTIADSNIALLNRRYYPEIKIAFPIEKLQSLGWAVKKGEKALLRKINGFFKDIKESGIFAKIYQKYYVEGVDIF